MTGCLCITSAPNFTHHKLNPPRVPAPAVPVTSFVDVTSPCTRARGPGGQAPQELNRYPYKKRETDGHPLYDEKRKLLVLFTTENREAALFLIFQVHCGRHAAQ